LTSRGLSIFNNTSNKWPKKAFHREIIQTIVVGIKPPTCDPEKNIKVIIVYKKFKVNIVYKMEIHFFYPENGNYGKYGKFLK